MTQPLDIITNATIDIGALAPGDHMDSNLANFAFNTLNDMLDQWSNENMMVFNTQEIITTLIAGKYVYTLGVGGEINATRPLFIKSAFARVATIDYPVSVITIEQYELIGLKALNGPWPRALWYNAGVPLGTVTFWPNPSVCEMHMFADSVFTSFITINDTVQFPQGYNMAMRHCLAELLLASYGKTSDQGLIQLVQNNARKAEAFIKGTNQNPPQVARFDVAIAAMNRTDAGFIMHGGFL